MYYLYYQLVRTSFNCTVCINGNVLVLCRMSVCILSKLQYDEYVEHKTGKLHIHVMQRET